LAGAALEPTCQSVSCLRNVSWLRRSRPDAKPTKRRNDPEKIGTANVVLRRVQRPSLPVGKGLCLSPTPSVNRKCHSIGA
jgi:hypothetical protein